MKSGNRQAAPDGWFLYAWNEARTIAGSEYSSALPSFYTDGNSKNLSIKERDAFVMIEVGETIDTNFCVHTIQQIPMLTVLESQSGSVEIQRSEKGYQAILNRIFRDRYSKRTIQFAGCRYATNASETLKSILFRVTKGRYLPLKSQRVEYVVVFFH